MFQAGHWREKVIGAGLFGLFVAVEIVVWRSRDGASFLEQVVVLIAIPTLIMVAGGALARADFVRRRLRAGKPVGPVSRLFFGAGVWSFLIWIIAMLVIGFPLAIWIGSLTSEMPAG
jgi:hypothetical protein